MIKFVFCKKSYRINLKLSIFVYFRPFVNGLEKYEDAAERGRNGEDCALYYDECQVSSLDKLPKFFH